MSAVSTKKLILPPGALWAREHMNGNDHDTSANKRRPPIPELTPSDAMRPRWRFWRVVARTLFFGFFRGRVLGVRNVPRSGPVLLVSTHQSVMDPVLASLAFDRECNFMARESLFEHKFFARLIGGLNAFPVRRNTADMRAIKETLRRLKSGRMILIFPEGTRTIDGRIGELQPGVAAIAKQARATVVPTLIEGAFDAWPRDAKLPRSSKIVVRYDRPITPEQAAEMSKSELLELIDRRLREMQAEVRPIYGFPPLPGTDAHSARTRRGVAPDFGRGWHFRFVADRMMMRKPKPVTSPADATQGEKQRRAGT